MSCYFRHMKHIFDEIGITVASENKKIIDRTIHNILKVEYKNCSAAWKQIKKHIKKDEKTKKEFIKTLKNRLNGI